MPESNINRDLFEGLLISDVEGHPTAGVAEKWDNKDFKVWTFHLRKDAKWSDGSPVTAQDFVYSWQRHSGSENRVSVCKLSAIRSYREYR